MLGSLRSACAPSGSGRALAPHQDMSSTALRLRPQRAQLPCMRSTSERLGVVVVDHGSRRKQSNHMLEEFCELYRQTSGRSIVEVAHMEIAEPTIEQAVERCVQQGATKVIIAPYFLSRGRHIQDDIPALVDAAQQKFPNTKCVVAEPIGIDPLMAQLIENRVTAAVDQL